MNLVVARCVYSGITSVEVHVPGNGGLENPPPVVGMGFVKAPDFWGGGIWGIVARCDAGGYG